LLGNLLDVQRDALGLIDAATRDHGPVARLRFASQVIYLMTSPDAARHVLQENHFNYSKDVPTFAFLRRVLGNGLFTSDGKFWLRQRRLAQPAFHRHRVAAFADTMSDEATTVAERWQALAGSGRPIDVAPEMMRLTLNVVTRALFTAERAEDVSAIAESITTLVEDITVRFNHPFYPPPGLPTPRNRRFRHALRTLDRVVYGIIAERRRQRADTGDLLGLLLEARDEESGEGMTDKQLRDEVATFYLAGHETTAVALTWVWYLLSTHPDVASRLHAELDDVLNGRVPSLGDLPSLPYTLMVIEEAMRLYPPVWITSRKAIADDVIGGYRVPANAIVAVSPYAVHHSRQLWDDPDRFDPERFASERVKDRPPFAYFPFGGGPRQCIGMGFALMEAQLILATLAQRFVLDLVPGTKVVPLALATLRPAHGLPMTIRNQ
jgi:cytochrome P450